MSNPGRTGLFATLGLTAVTAAWGSTFFLIKDVLAVLSVLDFLAVRFVVAAVVMVVAFWRPLRRLDARAWRRGALLGLVYGVGQILQTQGLETTDASVSGFITGMYVVLTPVLAALLLRQRTPASTWLAVGLATGGLAVLSLRGLAVGSGELITLVAAAVYALHIVGLGAWSRHSDALGLSTVQMLVIAGVCLLGAADGVEMPPDGATWLAVLYMGVVAGAGALVVQTWAQAHLTATRAAIVMTTEPVFAATFAVLFGGESLGPRVLLGGALVLAAMYLTELAPRRRQGISAALDPPAEALHHEP
ncbi:MAG TPA: DMT family transporter [Actinomycetales bacterium]|nr:DMT family transporter [Actinomycetales bacterium]